jgi:hypothetical protein
MRRTRLVLLVSLLVLAPVLSACENFDMDKLDVFGLNEKKKIPGDRKPLFPEGVPGVSQGVPPELIKGNKPPPEAAQAEPSLAEKAAEVEPPKPKVKRKPKPPAALQPTQIKVQPAAQDSSASQQQTNWPAPQQAQPGASAPWPSSPAPGTFQR